MDRHANRKAWLLRYRAQYKRVGAAAEALGIEANYLSSIIGKGASRNLGDVAARKIEMRMGLPRGALDAPPPVESPAAPAPEELHADQIQLAGIWKRLDALGRMKLMGFAMGLDANQGSSITQQATLPINLTLPKASRGTDSAK